MMNGIIGLQTRSVNFSLRFKKSEDMSHKRATTNTRTVHTRADFIFAGCLLLQELVLATIAPEATLTRPVLLAGSLASLVLIAWVVGYAGTQSARRVIGFAQLALAGICLYQFGNRIESHLYLFVSMSFALFYQNPYFIRFLMGVKKSDIDLLEEQEEFEIRLEQEVTERTREMSRLVMSLREERDKAVELAKVVSLGELSSNIVHEISNPLTTIEMKIIELIELCQAGDLDARLCESLSVEISKSTSRIARIINSIRSYVKEDGKHPPHNALVDDIVQDALLLCQQKFQRHQVELRLKPSPYLSLLRCRPAQISQVLLSLLNSSLNAVEGSNQAWVEIAWTDSPDLTIIVTSSSSGVPKGIGLNLCHEIVQQHEGTLEISSDAGTTCFILKFSEMVYESSQSA